MITTTALRDFTWRFHLNNLHLFLVFLMMKRTLFYNKKYIAINIIWYSENTVLSSDRYAVCSNQFRFHLDLPPVFVSVKMEEFEENVSFSFIGNLANNKLTIKANRGVILSEVINNCKWNLFASCRQFCIPATIFWTLREGILQVWNAYST